MLGVCGTLGLRVLAQVRMVPRDVDTGAQYLALLRDYAAVALLEFALTG